MSQFSTMTTRERKMQAAAICAEIQGPDGAEMDLGKKVKAPKDIMLEELSLTSNRGSRLFEMRQRRCERFTFESVQNGTNTQINNGMTPQAENLQTLESQCVEEQGVDQPSKTPPNTPDPRTESNPEIIAPGYGGPLKDVPPEKFNSTAVPKSYHSPWDQAIYNDPNLAETLTSCTPEQQSQPEAPSYKSFNRVATPFGGFNKSLGPALFKPPDVDSSTNVSLPEDPELQVDTAMDRPTFNRSALGWVSAGIPVLPPTASLDPMLMPESDDL